MQFDKYSQVSEYALPFLRKWPDGVLLYMKDATEINAIKASGTAAKRIWDRSPNLVVGLYKLTPFTKARDICDMIIEDVQFCCRLFNP